jgi:hypothetical protein
MFYMSALAEAQPSEQMVQQLAGQMLWLHSCVLLEMIPICAEVQAGGTIRLGVNNNKVKTLSQQLSLSHFLI